MKKTITKFRCKKGFTLVEAIVAISILIVVIAMTTKLFTDSFASKRKTEISRMIYEEARVTLERIVKEVRKGTIDYEEYFSWNNCDAVLCELDPDPTDDNDYGKNYGHYAKQFYREADGTTVPAELADVNRFKENVGKNTGSDPLGSHKQDELYLITAEGSEKTIIKLKDDGGEDRLVMLKLPGRDSDADGQVDEWKIYNAGSTNPSPSQFYDYCSTYLSNVCTTRQFQKIQPDSIQITGLKFFIAPLEDPRKAFAEFTTDVQQQPHVTIELTAEPSANRARGIRGDPPVVKLQTTVGARAQNEVKSLR